jgi:hypothetical protein
MSRMTEYFSGIGCSQLSNVSKVFSFWVYLWQGVKYLWEAHEIKYWDIHIIYIIIYFIEDIWLVDSIDCIIFHYGMMHFVCVCEILRFTMKCALLICEPYLESSECCALILLLSVQETYPLYYMKISVLYCSVGLCVLIDICIYRLIWCLLIRKCCCLN